MQFSKNSALPTRPDPDFTIEISARERPRFGLFGPWTYFGLRNTIGGAAVQELRAPEEEPTLKANLVEGGAAVRVSRRSGGAASQSPGKSAEVQRDHGEPRRRDQHGAQSHPSACTAGPRNDHPTGPP